jgi:hypothetical protein
VLIGERTLAEEVPVAFSYDGATHAVLMATGRDPAITAAARALLAARCAHHLVIDRGRWVSAELPDYCDLDGV